MEVTMSTHIHIDIAGLIFIVASIALQYAGHSMAADAGNLGLSASVTERCQVDFSEGSADYFQSCTSAEIKASGSASNVLGELTAVEAAADPFYLDRDPDSQGMAKGAQNTLASDSSALTERKRHAPKVVTIQY
jgi:hypothetical protein